MLFAACALGYLAIYWPLEDAANHKESVSLFWHAVILIPVFLGFGISPIVLGHERAYALAETRWGGVFGWLMAGAGLLLYVWLKAQLAAMGYDA
jgi:hypothetical protein